jgi:hypothetical protein
MSEIQNGLGAAVAGAPLFALRTLREARHGIKSDNPLIRRGKIPKDALAKLHEGSIVKVLAEAPTHVQRPMEFIWLRIKHVDRPAKRLVGEVLPPDNDIRAYRRSQHHGLVPGMLISFEEKHIFDMRLQRSS